MPLIAVGQNKKLNRFEQFPSFIRRTLMTAMVSQVNFFLLHW